jgi:putative glutathione S-transferase
MGILMNGQWQPDDLVTSDKQGNFQRPQSIFRGTIGTPEFPAESGRYHLYVSHACPWAHRTLLFRALKDLEDHISFSVVNPLMKADGWELDPDADPVLGTTYLRDVYLKADPHYTGRVTVPVLWDKHHHTIVNNESGELIRQFNSAFNAITGNTLDFYPEPLRPAIDEMNALVYAKINNGVYKCGFAKSQHAYDTAIYSLFGALDQLEDHLETHEYLAGDQITEADLRLFTTLVRFDPVYVTHFKCNLKRIADYKNITRLFQAIYYFPKVKETIHMEDIKLHYYGSHKHLNPSGIIAAGFPLKI